MADIFDKTAVSAAAAQIIKETLASLGNGLGGSEGPQGCAQPSGGEIKHIHSRDVRCAPFPFDIGAAGRGVASADILTLDESPRLGAGVMEVRGVSFPWTLNYDEVEFIIEGVLCITANGKKRTATAGDIIFIPRGTSIEFSSPSRARFLYVTYPADWQSNV